MATVLWVLAVLAGLLVLFVVWRLWATAAGVRRTHAAFAARIAPVTEALAAGREPDPADLERFAQDRTTRRVLREVLEHHGRASLFPAAWATPEATAEGDLTLWLAHPNELTTPPDEIELTATLPVPGAPPEDSHRYYLYRYRALPPHWAAPKGWMAGVAGPFPTEGPCPSHGAGTFSQFEAYESRPPEEHVAHLHRLTGSPQPARAGE